MNEKPKRTALLSVYDKAGIVEFARALYGLGIDIWASGGTAKKIKDAGIPVTDVATIVGEPILGHRVVTLSREIFAGLLATDSSEDQAELARINVPKIDLVHVTLYPLEGAIEDPERTLESVLDKTDIGGPTLLRAAAKGRRIVVTSAQQRGTVLERIRKSDFMNTGSLDDDRYVSTLAAAAERLVANYATASAGFLEQHAGG